MHSFLKHQAPKIAHSSPRRPNILSALESLPSGSDDSIVISPLETNKFYVRRFIISGLSQNLVFRLRNHWERYKMALKLYPDWVRDYKLEITLNTGEIAPFQEAVAPPSERFRPIDDSRLAEFVLKFSACISRYVTGSCPDGGSWDGADKYCSRSPR
jgi:hypothetical protein